MSKTTNIAVIGAGYWGKNYVRNLANIEEANLIWVCDKDQNALQRAKKIAPKAKITENADEVFSDPEVEGVVIATDVDFHHALTMEALKYDKHVLVEKPLAASVNEAKEMAQFAKEKKRILLVGHLMLFHPAVIQLKSLIQSGELGQIFYMYALRVNLGRIRHDENALFSLAPHDLSILNYLLDEQPICVSARGRDFLQDGIEDVVFVNLDYPSKTMAQVQLSWLDPHKERRLTVVGSKKMVVFDDTHATEKLKIYDKGVNASQDYNTYGEYLSLRNGDIHIPRVSLAEPLTTECNHFLACIRGDESPKSTGEDGLKIVEILHAAQSSLEADGAPIQLVS